MEEDPGGRKWPRKAKGQAHKQPVSAPAPKTTEARLQSFVQTQREAHAGGKLDQWKVETLEAFEWWRWKLNPLPKLPLE